MKIAIVGCSHGEMETIYDAITSKEKEDESKVDLLLCCGDFQALRNENDFCCMASKRDSMGSFYKYYSGEKVAPVLTLFIGGNHEASNYLQELPFGGWVAPNIYYLGSAGCVNVSGIRIAGISGIYKKYDYWKDRTEVPPYTGDSLRSVYHIRRLEVFRLMQLSNKIDICLSHDWPENIDKFGDLNWLIEKRPHLQEEITKNILGSPPTAELLRRLQPSYWFSAHLHVFYEDIVHHQNSDLKTKFNGLGKCCPGEISDSKYLEIIDVEVNDQPADIQLSYDLEWLTVLYLTENLRSSRINMKDHYKTTKRCEDAILERFDGNLIIPENFCRTASTYDPLSKEENPRQPKLQINPQTTLFCTTLRIRDPLLATVT